MIMLVDDDIGMREICSLFLESEGFEVHVAANGADALLKMQETPPDLLITDCAMPGMTGVELSESLRADPMTAHIPILLISASLRRDIACSDCYDGFLRKPFLAEKLLVEVQKLLAGAGSLPPATPGNQAKV